MPADPSTWQETPRRTFRIPDEVYAPAQEKAEREGETVTDVVIRALTVYAAPPPASE